MSVTPNAAAGAVTPSYRSGMHFQSPAAPRSTPRRALFVDSGLVVRVPAPPQPQSDTTNSSAPPHAATDLSAPPAAAADVVGDGASEKGAGAECVASLPSPKAVTVDVGVGDSLASGVHATVSTQITAMSPRAETLDIGVGDCSIDEAELEQAPSVPAIVALPQSETLDVGVGDGSIDVAEPLQSVPVPRSPSVCSETQTELPLTQSTSSNTVAVAALDAAIGSEEDMALTADAGTQPEVQTPLPEHVSLLPTIDSVSAIESPAQQDSGSHVASATETVAEPTISIELPVPIADTSAIQVGIFTDVHADAASLSLPVADTVVEQSSADAPVTAISADAGVVSTEGVVSQLCHQAGADSDIQPRASDAVADNTAEVTTSPASDGVDAVVHAAEAVDVVASAELTETVTGPLPPTEPAAASAEVDTAATALQSATEAAAPEQSQTAAVAAEATVAVEGLRAENAETAHAAAAVVLPTRSSSVSPASPRSFSDHAAEPSLPLPPAGLSASDDWQPMLERAHSAPSAFRRRVKSDVESTATLVSYAVTISPARTIAAPPGYAGLRSRI